MHAIEVHMQMHQIRHFLALCEECNFTRAAKWSGITQPSLTNAISALERESGGALFQRKQFIVLTALGHAIQPYLRRIAETTAHACEAAQAFRSGDCGDRPAAAGDAESRVHLGLTAGGGSNLSALGVDRPRAGPALWRRGRLKNSTTLAATVRHHAPRQAPLLNIRFSVLPPRPGFEPRSPPPPEDLLSRPLGPGP